MLGNVPWLAWQQGGWLVIWTLKAPTVWLYKCTIEEDVWGQIWSFLVNFTWIMGQQVYPWIDQTSCASDQVWSTIDRINKTDCLWSSRYCLGCLQQSVIPGQLRFFTSHLKFGISITMISPSTIFLWTFKTSDVEPHYRVHIVLGNCTPLTREW